MKNIKTYNETLKDKLKGKSNDELMDSIKDMNVLDRIKKIRQHGLDDNLMPCDEEIRQHFKTKYGSNKVAFSDAMEIGYLPAIKERIGSVMTGSYASYITYYLDSISNNYLEILKLLIERKPSLPKSFLTRLLSHSRYKRKPEIEEYLRQVIRDRYNVNIIYESLKDKLKGKSEDEVIKSLKKLENNPIDLLFRSVDIGYLDGVKRSFELKDFDPYERNLYLIRSASSGYLDIVKYLINHIEYDDETLSKSLMNAISYNKLDVVDYLVKNGASLYSTSINQLNSNLRLASIKGHYDSVLYLLSNTEFDKSVLKRSIELASKEGHQYVVKLLKQRLRTT